MKKLIKSKKTFTYFKDILTTFFVQHKDQINIQLKHFGVRLELLDKEETDAL